MLAYYPESFITASRNMKTTIKNAKYTDLNKINELMGLSKGYWKYEPDFLKTFIKKFRLDLAYIKKNSVKLLYLNSSLAGFYSFCVNKEDLLMLDNFFLHPNYIGKGIGRILWEACCKTAKELKKNAFIICSDPHAEDFYLKLGCEKIGLQQSMLCPTRYLPILKYQLSG